MSALICDRCGARVLPDDVRTMPVVSLDIINRLRARGGHDPLAEQPGPILQHYAWRRRRIEGRDLCGPLRPATEWDEWLWRLGAVKP